MKIKSWQIRYVELGTEESVFNRSLTCDIEFPEYSPLSDAEVNFPLAFAITAYMDSRSIGKQAIKDNVLNR